MIEQLQVVAGSEGAHDLSFSARWEKGMARLKNRGRGQDIQAQSIRPSKSSRPVAPRCRDRIERAFMEV